jgi:septum formation protein
VISVVWLLSAEREDHAISISEVRVATLSEQRISNYLDCGEAYGKAGAYAIQGRAAGFIEHLSGSHSAVMGLPLYETQRLLEQFGLEAAA